MKFDLKKHFAKTSGLVTLAFDTAYLGREEALRSRKCLHSQELEGEMGIRVRENTSVESILLGMVA